MPSVKRHFKTIRAVAATTDKELCGQPVIMLLILTGIILTALIPLLHFHDFGEAGRICRDGGLAYQLLIGTIITVVASSASIHDEITNGTVLAALGKPISRNSFLAGKWLGVMITTFRFWLVTLFSTLIAWRIPKRFTNSGEDGAAYITDNAMQTALLLIPIIALITGGVLHNKKHKRFCITVINATIILTALTVSVCVFFDRRHAFNIVVQNLDYKAIPVSVLIFFAISIYGSIAAALSTRLKAPVVLAVSFLLIALGLSADSITSFSPITALLPLPNLQSFWMIDVLSGNAVLAPSYLLIALLYTISTVTLYLAIGSLLFRNRDLG